MACYKPIHGFKRKDRKGFTINPAQGLSSCPMTIPCGYCIGCRLERSRQWAMRCVHEASMHEKNCFITLTFSPQALKDRGTGSLRKRDFQLFIKRLRKAHGKGIRYLHCGEYGSKRGRPHYHACIFGFDFKDKQPFKGNLWRSSELERLWPYGYSSIGELTFESAAYVARYVVKKRYGKDSAQFYEKVFEPTGELETLLPEYATMSRRPGIGRGFLERYHSDIYPKDSIIVRGTSSRPCRYYDKYFEALEPVTYAKIKGRRKAKAVSRQLDKNQPSLDSRETHAKANLSANRRRSFEEES